MSEMYERLRQDPLHLIDTCYYDIYDLTPEQTADIQLTGMRRRFGELRPKLAVLDKLATEQKIDEIRVLNDAAPLLFPHTVYKSYPMVHLERGNFQRLTRWLQGLTTIDLGSVDSTGLESIDEWLDELDRKTPLRVFHSSGTTGKLSFVPRTEEQYRQHVTMSSNVIRHHFGRESGPETLGAHMPIVSPTYRYGASNGQRLNPMRIEMVAGDSENALFMYPNSRLSADLLSLSGRLRTAEARGELGQFELSPSLLRRREELTRLERERPAELKRFFETLQERYAGKDVFMLAIWTLLYHCAAEGEARGLRNVFGRNSVLITGGGLKGQKLPSNYREICTEFLGFANFYEMYGMSEWMSIAWRCERGNYHIPPTLVSFLLDPGTGEVAPRTDGQTGRFAAFDLLTTDYWAGLVSGDEVTWSGWQKSCPCDRKGPFIYPTIRRYSEKEGGDDRILCSGAPAAHDSAAAFLAALSG